MADAARVLGHARGRDLELGARVQRVPHAERREATWAERVRDRGRLSLVAGGGITWLRPRFRVGFTDAFGNYDGTEVAAELQRASVPLAAGADEPAGTPS